MLSCAWKAGLVVACVYVKKANCHNDKDDDGSDNVKYADDGDWCFHFYSFYFIIDL